MKETNNNVKGLKKQLAAAVAMVCVAAVALGSSTYACKRWNGAGLLSTQKYAEIYFVF